MIRKVALVQALREAFPKTFGGMYTADEQDIAENIIDVTPPDIQDVSGGEEVDEPEATPESGPAADDPAASFFDQ